MSRNFSSHPLTATSRATQDDFADLLGISHSHIHRIEKAKSEIPVDAICTVLGAEKDWLLTGQGEMLKAETPLPDYGSHIRELREYLGLSLNTMAAELGVNPTNFSRNECGQAPSKDTINKIRSVYGVRYKLKQEDVAKRTGLGHTTISNT